MRRPVIALLAFAGVLALVVIEPAFIAFPMAVAASTVWCFLLEREK